MKLQVRRGSSLVFLGLSVIVFLIVYGIAFYILSIVLSSFFSAFVGIPISDPGWASTNSSLQKSIQFIIPLAPTLGLFMLILKVLLTASVKGND